MEAMIFHVYDLDLQVPFSALFDAVLSHNKRHNTPSDSHKRISLEADSRTGQVEMRGFESDTEWEALVGDRGIVRFIKPSIPIFVYASSFTEIADFPILTILLNLSETFGGTMLGFVSSDTEVSPFCVIKGQRKGVVLALADADSGELFTRQPAPVTGNSSTGTSTDPGTANSAN